MYNKADVRANDSCCCCRTIISLFLTVMASIAFCWADETVLSKSEEGQLYDEAVHILGGNANVISRWVDPVRLAVINAPNDQSDAYAQTITSEIAVQTELNWSLIEHDVRDADVYHARLLKSDDLDLSLCDSNKVDECANLVVLFGSVADIKRIAAALPLRAVYQRSLDESDNVLCFFAPFLTSSQEIRKAFVYVNRELSQEMLNTCLQEEIYQSFGLFNDYTDSKFFSFNNREEPKSITKFDKALLASVYDPSLKAGAPVFAVMERLINRLGINPFEK